MSNSDNTNPPARPDVSKILDSLKATITRASALSTTSNSAARAAKRLTVSGNRATMKYYTAANGQSMAQLLRKWRDHGYRPMIISRAVLNMPPKELRNFLTQAKDYVINELAPDDTELAELAMRALFNPVPDGYMLVRNHLESATTINLVDAAVLVPTDSALPQDQLKPMFEAWLENTDKKFGDQFVFEGYAKDEDVAWLREFLLTTDPNQSIFIYSPEDITSYRVKVVYADETIIQ